MRTYTFENINSIQKVQFLTDTTGYILDNNGDLSHFSGNYTEKINTPDHINISNFHFITEREGAIIGHSTKNTQEASMLGISTILIVTLLLFAIVKKISKKYYSKRFIRISLLAFLLIGFTISCNNDWEKNKEQDPGSPFTTIIKTLYLSTGYHNFGGNAGQDTYISITTDKGVDWETFDVPTNFDLTSIVAIGKNYFVGTYADKSHCDGDVWIFGNDSTYSKRLAINKNEDPYYLSTNRGINGLKFYKEDSSLILYGGELIFTFPKDERSSTEGNVIEFKVDLTPDYKIIDVPEEVVINSYAKLNNGDVYITLENTKLLQTDGKKWNEIIIDNQAEFKQVEFIPKTKIGYTLSVKGMVYKTLNNGNNWTKTNIKDIEKMNLFENAIIFTKENTVLKLNN